MVHRQQPRLTAEAANHPLLSAPCGVLLRWFTGRRCGHAPDVLRQVLPQAWTVGLRFSMATASRVLDELARSGMIAKDWVPALRVADPAIDDELEDVLAKVRAASPVLPKPSCIWRAFTLPLAQVEVLVLGQDPYPNAAHAVGLSFSTGAGGPIPGSLQNIYRELFVTQSHWPADGDLSAWSGRGVMLLNRALTLPVDPAARPRRHIRWWRPLAIATMSAIAREAAERPIAALLWGTPAHRMRRYLEPNVQTFASSHPSGMSATRPAGGERPFRDSSPFVAVNAWRRSRGASEIDWSL